MLPPWGFMLLGLAFFGVALLRYNNSSVRSWEISVFAGVTMIVAGVFVAIKRRSLR